MAVQQCFKQGLWEGPAAAIAVCLTTSGLWRKAINNWQHRYQPRYADCNGEMLQVSIVICLVHLSVLAVLPAENSLEWLNNISSVVCVCLDVQEAWQSLYSLLILDFLQFHCRVAQSLRCTKYHADAGMG